MLYNFVLILYIHLALGDFMSSVWFLKHFNLPGVEELL